jgi:hypothetical protein
MYTKIISVAVFIIVFVTCILPAAVLVYDTVAKVSLLLKGPK